MRRWLALLLAVAAPLSAAAEGARSAPPTGSRHEPPRKLATPQSTLEPALERAAERLLRAADPVEGAVVAVEVATGRLLAFAPFTRSADAMQVLTRARLPAASLFKIVTTAALFESTSVGLRDEVCIEGGMHGIERRHLEPARGAGRQCGPFAHALGHSKNAVFAQLATRRLLREDLVRVAERFGFNAELPFEMPAELGRLTVPYNDLEFARTACGFQGSSLSPLGAAHLMTTIARGGVPVQLRLHDSTDVSSLDDTLLPAPPERAVTARTAEQLTRMLEVTVETGTSRAAFKDSNGRRYLPGIRVAGKTGTLRPDQPDQMTSWFVGFAPSRSPEIVVSVLLVNGKVYRRKANEVARDVLRSYFRSRGRPGVTSPFEDAGVAAKPRATASAELPVAIAEAR